MTWYFSVTKSASRPSQFVAIAKRQPIVGDGQPDSEPGNIWNEYGDSPQDALSRLYRMLPDRHLFS